MNLNLIGIKLKPPQFLGPLINLEQFGKIFLRYHIHQYLNGKIKKKYSFYKYFDIGKCFEQPKTKTSIKTYKDNFLKALTYRCISDVEIGVYVSGGIDSSAVAAALAALGYKNMRSYSISFDNKEFDESKFQKLCAGHFNFNHTSISISEKELINNFKKTLWHTENIMFRTAPIPMFLLSQKVSEDGIKVVITGEGSDEFNYGYNIFKEHDLISNWEIISEEEKRKKNRPFISLYIFAKDKTKRSKFFSLHVPTIFKRCFCKWSFL